MESYTPTTSPHFSLPDPLNDGFILEEPSEEHNQTLINTPISHSPAYTCNMNDELD